ncbi:MAG: glycosyltransferase family 39 protein [candidate division Zixibacteria bacterium]|nr:glycosyltransferase family 39 protein [candidate division Zixibacteria bacterium]
MTDSNLGNSSDIKKYTRRFWYLNTAFLVFHLIYINFPELAPQEAYYWNYARHLALSYFDHPPMHAWLIYLTTQLGISEFTVRLSAPILAFGTAFLCFQTGSLLFDVKIGFYFFLTISAILLYNIGSVILTPDVPLLFFWCLGFYFFVKLIQTGKAGWWYPLGVCLGLAMLSKYTGAFMALSVCLFIILSKEHRYWLRMKEPYLAALLSFLVFSPVIIWNAENNWASFLFQTSRRAGELGSLSLRHFVAYVGSQMGVISPLIYGFMWYALGKLTISILRTRDSVRLALFSWSAPTIFFFTLVALKYWVKMNWLAPGYVAAVLAGTALFFSYRQGENQKLSKQKRRFGLTSLTLGFIFVALGYASPFLPISLGKGEAIYGWKQLATTVDSIRKEMQADQTIIIGYEYKTASELAFYLPDRPEVYSNSFVGEKGLAYDYWSRPDQFRGRNAIFVYDQRNRYKSPEELSQMFDRVEKSSEFKLDKGGKEVTTFHIYKCYGYKGAD